MHRFALLSAVSLAAFANAPKTTAVPAAASASKRRERTDVKVFGAAAAMALPSNVSPSRRGGRSKYKFDELVAPVPNPEKPGEFLYASFGLTGMDKKGFNSTLFTANNKYKKQIAKIGEDGQPVTKQVEIKDASGAVVGHKAEPEMIDVTEREFIAVDVDPKTDPENATLRVFRTK